MSIIKELKVTFRRLHLPKFKTDNKTTTILNNTNLVVTELRATETNVNITRLNDIMYAATSVFTKEA